MNNLCIAPCLFYVTELCERYQQELEAFIWWMKNLLSMYLVFTTRVGVKHFWVDINEKHVFVPTSSIGVVHIWVICT
jgi:alpha-glucosidase (family GH31 glycosyl hydrolase)